MKKADKMIAKLNKLTPSQFENLVYDMMVLFGLKNAVWRTPGPDAGRDIQGQTTRIDYSGQTVVESWYVECKKHAKSVDWPTIYEKLSYAENHDADFLLVVTTASLTPRCKEEIQRRELARKRPYIRFWEGAYLNIILPSNPILLSKYGLLFSNDLEGKSVLPIMSHASKAIQAAYGVSVFKDIEIMELELSASLVDLILARIGEIREYGGIIIKKFIPDRDLYNWSKIDDGIDLSVFDSFGVRALLAAIRVCFKNDEIFIKKSDHADFEIKINEFKSSVFNEIVKQIVVWSNLMVRIENLKILVNSK